MKGYSDTMPDLGIGEISCWWFRWHDACRPGCYVFDSGLGYEWGSLKSAVVDDFGNLVPVE